MQPSIYKINCSADGALFVMPKPSSEWLGDDLRAYRSMGIDRIVSLLTREEIDELGLEDERDLCGTHGIVYEQLSIIDRGLPPTNEFTKLAANLSQCLLDGQSVSVHCRAGIGRSGMLASCCLIHLGMTAEQSIAAVSAGRGVSIPDTEEQKDFILGYRTMSDAFRQE